MRTALAGILAAGVAIGVMGPGALSVRGQGYDQPYQEQLQGIEQRLRHGQWELARHGAQALTEVLAERSGGTLGDHRVHAGELGGAMASGAPLAEAQMLGRAALYRAIAEAMLGSEEDARWHWYLAQNLCRELRATDLSPYGRASRVLAPHVLRDADVQHADVVDVFDPVRPEAQKKGTTFKEPVRTKVVYPQRPRDLRDRDRFSHVVFVQITVDATGRVVQPLVLDGGFYPGLIYRAFDALRQWEYQAATVNGRPVSYRYVVPVVFSDDGARPKETAF